MARRTASSNAYYAEPTEKLAQQRGKLNPIPSHPPRLELTFRPCAHKGTGGGKCKLHGRRGACFANSADRPRRALHRLSAKSLLTFVANSRAR